jgi:hypothetical protein
MKATALTPTEVGIRRTPAPMSSGKLENLVVAVLQFCF